MRRLDWKVFVLIGIIISVIVGFLYGTGILGGDSADPGSSSDPLISSSYAEQAMTTRMRELEDRIIGLESSIKSLEDRLNVFLGEEPADSATATDGAGSTAAGSTGAGSTGTSGTAAAGTGAASSSNINKQATVNADVVNLRESASTSSNILKKLTPSDTFTITKVDKDWYQVQLSDGTTGWVFWNLVKIK